MTKDFASSFSPIFYRITQKHGKSARQINTTSRGDQNTTHVESDVL